MRLLKLIEQQIETLLMIGREGLEFDPDTVSPAPPNIRGWNRDGQVLSRKEQEIDHGIGGDPDGILNSAALLGKVDGPGNMRPIMCHQSARKRHREPLVAPFDHDTAPWQGIILIHADAMPLMPKRRFSTLFMCSTRRERNKADFFVRG